MGSRIKGIVVEIGGDTTGLDKALSGTNKQISDTQKELADVTRLLKLDPQNVTLLEQKQRLLAKATDETKSKLATLEEANKQVSDSVKNYDAWKAAYDPIQKEIDSTKKKLDGLKAEQKAMEEVGETNSEAYAKITEEVHKTAKSLQSLRKDAKAVNEEFGNPVSPEQYDALQREIAATQQDLKRAEKAMSDFASESKDVDEKPVREVDEAADKAKDSLKKAGKEASSFGDILKAEIVADKIKDVGDSLKDVAEESKDHRKVMASLEVSSAKAGYTSEQTSEAYRKLYGVLADDQSAATTVANLQAIGLSQSELLGLTDSMIGAWANYGDSIPIDGLAEAVNETIKTGQVTGVLADVLNWGTAAGETFGVTMKEATEENEAWNQSVADAKTAEDFFNLSLQGCADETERANQILQMLANQGLAESGQAWQENNQGLVESNQAQADMQDQLAELGETVEPVFTKITNAVSALLGWFNSLDGGTQNVILTILGVVTAIVTLMPIISGLSTAITGLGTVMSFLAANPIVLIIAAVVAMIAAFAIWGDEIKGALQKVDDFLQNIFAVNFSETFGFLAEPLDLLFANFKNMWAAIKKILDGIIDFIQGVFSGNWEQAWEGLMNIVGGIVDGLEATVKGAINGIIGIINGTIGGFNFVISGANEIPGVNIPKIGEIPYLATGGEVLRGSAIVGEAGPELLTVAPGRTIVQPLGSSTTNHNSTHLGSVNITVYGAPGQDVRALAGIIMEEMQYAYDSKVVAL